ncbi:NDR1/HIN1-like protein 26 [Andrographis paniculata]|uniref:NDR1/HIN1-like protein 26 n=1 Tax=Andrographis paniculata TaxID=175694 RepID=UPI0021E91E67|nr:NDR1/HIN1-like protein 26 [Andrographis paniculata]
MRSPENRIPIRATPEMMKRHHSAHYYAHRVKESLTTRVSKLVCTIFLGLLFLVGIITFILWLSLRPHRPRFHVQQFSIPALAAAAEGFENAQIIYNATVRNSNQNIGIYYDSSAITVFYEDQSIGGAPVLFPFYQEPKNTTVIAGVLGGASLTVTNQRWQQFLAARARGEVVFRLEITSTIRFKISSWDSKRHRVHANCPVGVGPDGLILPAYRDRKCPVYFS